MRNHLGSSNKGLSYLWAMALNYMTKRRGRFLTFVIIFCLAWLRGICSQTHTAIISAVSVIGFEESDKLWDFGISPVSTSLFVCWGKTNLRRPLGSLQRHRIVT